MDNAGKAAVIPKNKCPRCGEQSCFHGLALNMGYGRCIHIIECPACDLQWCNNTISGYLNIPTGILMKLNDIWVPEGCLIVWDDE